MERRLGESLGFWHRRVSGVGLPIGSWFFNRVPCKGRDQEVSGSVKGVL